jgi:hypothetical protein
MQALTMHLPAVFAPVPCSAVFGVLHVLTMRGLASEEPYDAQ